MRRNYWSCTKFADWLRGTPKLKTGTSEEWRAWAKTAKTKKWRYWLAEEGLDMLQNTIVDSSLKDTFRPARKPRD